MNMSLILKSSSRANVTLRRGIAIENHKLTPDCLSTEIRIRGTHVFGPPKENLYIYNYVYTVYIIYDIFICLYIDNLYIYTYIININI